MLRSSRIAFILLLSGMMACGWYIAPQGELKNAGAREHRFLVEMYADDHYPDHLVDKCRDVLITLCHAIEHEKPSEVKYLYPITHYATRQLNALQPEFDRAGSEMETVAREALAQEFAFIAEAYGFDADVEEMIAPREW